MRPIRCCCDRRRLSDRPIGRRLRWLRVVVWPNWKQRSFGPCGCQQRQASCLRACRHRSTDRHRRRKHESPPEAAGPSSNGPRSALGRRCRLRENRVNHSGRAARASKQHRPVCCRAAHRDRRPATGLASASGAKAGKEQGRSRDDGGATAVGMQSCCLVRSSGCAGGDQRTVRQQAGASRSAWPIRRRSPQKGGDRSRMPRRARSNS
jgi:hypothetical protein